MYGQKCPLNKTSRKASRVGKSLQTLGSVYMSLTPTREGIVPVPFIVSSKVCSGLLPDANGNLYVETSDMPLIAY